MSSTSEKGHAKNNANFKKLISIADNMGPAYTPQKTMIQVGTMKEMHTEADFILTNHKQAKDDFSDLTNERTEAFDLLNPLLPRIISVLVLADISAHTLDDANGFVAKMRGARRGDKNASAAKETGTSGESQDKSISVSQQSFDLKIDHFEKLLILVKGTPNYQTEEEQLTIKGLGAYFTELKRLNDAVIDATNREFQNRILRDKVLYDETTGVLFVASQVKAYLRTKEGGTQNENYKAAAKIQFNYPKDK